MAEKFEAIVKLGRANSRMKDLYDIWMLSREHEFKGAGLAQAIAATFARRKPKYRPNGRSASAKPSRKIPRSSGSGNLSRIRSVLNFLRFPRLSTGLPPSLCRTRWKQLVSLLPIRPAPPAATYSAEEATPGADATRHRAQIPTGRKWQ